MLAAQVMCVKAGAKAEQRPPRACRPELSKDLLSKQCSGRSGRNKGGILVRFLICQHVEDYGKLHGTKKPDFFFQELNYQGEREMESTL